MSYPGGSGSRAHVVRDAERAKRVDAVLLFLLRVKQATRAVLVDELAARCDGPKGVDAVLQWMGVHRA